MGYERLKIMKLIFTILFLASSSAFASLPSLVHLHKTSFSGVLPSPYETFDLEVELNEKTDDLESINLFRGTELIEIPIEIVKQLKEIELNTLKVSHEMHRRPGNPAEPLYEFSKDWLHISFEFGELYRADKVENDANYFQWGRDKFTITITKDNDITLEVEKVEDRHWNWSKLAPPTYKMEAEAIETVLEYLKKNNLPLTGLTPFDSLVKPKPDYSYLYRGGGRCIEFIVLCQDQSCNELQKYPYDEHEELCP